MYLVTFEAFNDKGELAGVLEINPIQVTMIMPARIPGELLGPSGEPVYEEKAALDLGGKLIVVNDSVEEAKRKIELGMNRI